MSKLTIVCVCVCARTLAYKFRIVNKNSNISNVTINLPLGFPLATTMAFIFGLS